MDPQLKLSPLLCSNGRIVLQLFTEDRTLSNSDHYGIVMEPNRKPEKTAKAKDQLIWRYSHADSHADSHQDVERTLDRLRQEVYWVSMARDVE